MSEPTWTYDSKLVKLDRKIQDIETNLKSKIDEYYATLHTSIQYLKADMYRQMLQEVHSILDQNKNEYLGCADNCEDISTDEEHNIVSIDSITLEDGSHITGNTINNKFNNIQTDLNRLQVKLNNAVKKFDCVDSFITSHNFRKSSPSQEQLYKVVLEKLFSNDINTELTKDSIPNATKIKNTYDNHIWILNVVTIDGLTTSKWEDLGADSICLATNDGVQGIVTGSHDRYKGFVDLQGHISINGLEDDISNILQSIQNINNELTMIKEDIFAKLNALEINTNSTLEE